MKHGGTQTQQTQDHFASRVLFSRAWAWDKGTLHPQGL